MLKIDALDVRYGAVQAISNVSLTIAAGETVALLGANGAGKTTLLRTLSGLVKPTAGSMTLADNDLSKFSAEARVRQGLIHVPERRRIFGGLTVEENLKVAASAWAGATADLTPDLEKVYTFMPRLNVASSKCWPLAEP